MVVFIVAENPRAPGDVAPSLVLGLLFSLPLIAHQLSRLVGVTFFLLADPMTRLVWSTLVQAAAGWPFYAGVFRRGGRAVPLVVAGASSALYTATLLQAIGALHYGGLPIPEVNAVGLNLALMAGLWRTEPNP